MVAAKKKSPRFYMPADFPEPEIERGPCARNRQIYDAVRVGLMTYRAAALEFKVAPSRIGQIVKQVELWIGKTGGGPLGSVRERVRVSEYLHRARADACYAKLHDAFEQGVETRTDRVKIVDGKPDERVITLKTVKRDGKVIVQAWKVDEDRHRFEVGGLDTPPSDLTPMERMREAGLILAEELAAQQKLDKELEEQMTNHQAPLTVEKSDYDPSAMYGFATEEQQDAGGRGCNPPAAESIDEASSTMTDRQRPMTDDPWPVGTAETLGAAGRLPTYPYPAATESAARRPDRGERRLECFPDEPPPMYLTKKPSQPELMRYYVIDEDNREEFRPPIIENGQPGEVGWFRYQPLPPASAWQLNWRKKNGVPWRQKKKET